MNSPSSTPTSSNPSTPSALPGERWRSHALPFLIMAIGYWLLQEASMKIAQSRPPFPIWLADGFALGVWFACAPRARPPLLLAVLLANLVDSDLDFKLTWNGFAGSMVNVFQLGAAAWLLTLARQHLRERWSRLTRMLAFAFVSAVLVNAVAALGSALVFHARNGVAVESAFYTLFISDGLGIILLTPLVVAWADPSLSARASRARALRPEAWLVYLLVALSAWLIFSLRPDAFGVVPPIFYLGVPFVLWAAARFELPGGALALTLYSLTAIYFTMRDLGPFAAGFIPGKFAVLQLQGFLAVMIVSTLLLSALMRDRRLAGREVRAWRQRYEATLRTSGNAVFEIEPVSGAIEWAGDTVGAIGIQEASIRTVRNWSARIHGDDRAAVSGLRARLGSGELPAVDLEYRVRDDEGGYRLLGVSAYGVAQRVVDPQLDTPGPRRIVGFVKDITEKNRLTAERRQLEAELRQAQKMDAIGRLAGGIAHDFNNILASILGYTELARGKVEPDSAQARYLDTIAKAGERGKLLVAQILTFSRKSPQMREPVDLVEIADEVTALVRGSHPHAVELRQYCTHQAAIVHGNPVELHQMVMNLATNGLQAMSGGGHLKIELDARDLAAPTHLGQGTLPAGRYVTIAVSDEGIGIDAATREKIFEPFFTTKPVGQGTGLGLSMAMTIAKTHGGGIDLISEPGKGSTFTVFLPTALAEPASPALEPVVMRGRSQRILVADDEPALRELATQILTELGYRCEAHADGAAAWAAFQAAPEKYDAILSDEVMPNLTGSDLAARIQALRPGLPMFLVTAYSSPGLELRAQQAGVLAILAKPYRRQDLAEALGKALAMESPLPPSL